MGTTSTRPLTLWLFTTTLALLTLLAPAACGAQTAPEVPARDKPLNLVATTGMVGDLVRRVAGERGQVTLLMGEGVDPHLYKPTRSDIATMSRADAVFYNGLLLEGKMLDALVRLASSGRKVFAVTEALPDDVLLTPEGFEGHHDPHVWMDPVAWGKAAQIVRDRLADIDPAGKPVYDANAAALLQELDTLDEYARRVLESVPERSRVLITAHDAFNYFGRRYSMEVLGVQGISTESEAGLKDIESLVNLIVERDVKAVFVETTVSDRTVRALIAGVQARGRTLAIGGSLFSDAMGPAGTYEGTYVGMMDHNITTIARALGGDAPGRGMQGELTPPPATGAEAPPAGREPEPATPSTGSPR